MTEEQLEKGEVLSKVIQTTKRELENLEDLLYDVEHKDFRKDIFYHDGLY